MPENSETAQWITFLTLVAGFLWQAYRENRNRRWAKEDSEDLAAKVGTVNTHITGLKDDIAFNTKVSTDAFEVANHVNEKLVAADRKIAEMMALFTDEGKKR